MKIENQPPPSDDDGSVVVLAGAAEPTLRNPEAGSFYGEAIRELVASGIPFLLAGTYAVSAYTGLTRETKDLDIFCKAGDFPRILAHFQDLGYAVEIEDERWIGKVFKGRNFFDVIFASSNGTMPVGETWFDHANQTRIFGVTVPIMAPTELVWSKSFVQLRHRYDGADIAHVLLRAHEQIDWRRLLGHMEVHWELLLAQLLAFRWIYPSERDAVPAWLLDELLERLDRQRQLPMPQMKVCRGRMLSRIDYEIDVKEWGFADVGGEGEWRGAHTAWGAPAMAERKGPIKVAALGDLHVKDDGTVSFRDLFGEISRTADVLVIAGDLTDLGKPREAELLAEDLRACSIPVVAVLGNHDYECDAVEPISQILRQSGVRLLDGQVAELEGVSFVGVKGFAGGFGPRMLGSFGEPAIKAMVAESVREAMRLENAIRQVRTERAVVVLHYAPIVETIEGEPLEIFPFLGSSRLGETVDRFPVTAVVHGHAHRGAYQGHTPKGTPVYNVALHLEKPTGRPYALLEI